MEVNSDSHSEPEPVDDRGCTASQAAAEPRTEPDPHADTYRGTGRPDPRTDADLLRAARREPAAFGELYRRRAAAVYAWLQRRAPHIASDLTAETFAQAWLHRRRFRDDRDGSALPWLLGIARHTLAESVRRDQVETRARERLGLPCGPAGDGARAGLRGGARGDRTGGFANAGGFGGADAAGGAGDDAGFAGVVARLSPNPHLKAALADLPDHEREALLLRVVHELPYREVARTLAIRPAAARLRVSRALRRLSIALLNAKEDQ